MLPNQVGAQKDASPTPSSLGGEPGDTAQDQIEEVASMEEVLLADGHVSLDNL